MLVLTSQTSHKMKFKGCSFFIIFSRDPLIVYDIYSLYNSIVVGGIFLSSSFQML